MQVASNNKNTVVLTIDELQRIKNSCSLSSTHTNVDKVKERETLYQKSQQRVKNWPNTIHALRKKKDEDRIRRLEEEEIKRREMEAEEEALQMELRNQTIEAANKAIYESQDRVKAFKSKMQMCEMMEERQQQDKLRKKKKKVEEKIEKTMGRTRTTANSWKGRKDKSCPREGIQEKNEECRWCYQTARRLQNELY